MAATTLESGDSRQGRLWARIPEPLNDEQRRARNDDPLARRLDDEGIAHVIRGFSLLPDANHVEASVGIEVLVEVPAGIAFAAEAIKDLGAPPTTVIELETDKAALRLTLQELL